METKTETKNYEKLKQNWNGKNSENKTETEEYFGT